MLKMESGFLMTMFQSIDHVALKNMCDGEMERMWKETVVI
jgi:hypothetical protein